MEIIFFFFGSPPPPPKKKNLFLLSIFAETQSFVLNFGGRVTQASVKNFQIVHPEDRMFF